MYKKYFCPIGIISGQIGLYPVFVDLIIENTEFLKKLSNLMEFNDTLKSSK